MDPVCFTRPTASGAHQPWGVSCTEIIDFFWREYRVVAEADGLLKYQNGADAVAELKRDRLLREQGLDVIHFTWQELFRERERVMRRTLAAFERARRLRRPPT
jgi:very-short-patch-repair endonuclease